MQFVDRRCIFLFQNRYEIEHPPEWKFLWLLFSGLTEFLSLFLVWSRLLHIDQISIRYFDMQLHAAKLIDDHLLPRPTKVIKSIDSKRISTANFLFHSWIARCYTIVNLYFPPHKRHHIGKFIKNNNNYCLLIRLEIFLRIWFEQTHPRSRERERWIKYENPKFSIIRRFRLLWMFFS